MATKERKGTVDPRAWTAGARRTAAAGVGGRPARSARASATGVASDVPATQATRPEARLGTAAGTGRARAATALHATTAMHVATDLRQRILRGEFAPGERLKIDDIAALCGVSHMPVRVALQELESEGVLDLFPHRGAVIRAVDARFVRNMLELRSSIEVMLTERCARLLDDAGIAEIERLARAFEQAAARNAPPAIVTANLKLHDAINRVADNPEALQVLGRGRLLIQALRVRYGFGPGRVATVIAEHDALVRALQRRDARRAGAIAKRHCEGARDELLALLP